MEIFKNTNKPAHVTALKVVTQPLKLLALNLRSPILILEKYTALFVFGWYQPKCTKPPLVHPTTH